MAVSDIKKIYQDVIDEVCKTVRDALLEEGYDDHTLQELRELWLKKLESSKALEPLTVSVVDQVTNREFRHPNTGELHVPSSNNKPPAGVRLNPLHPATASAVTTYNTNYELAATQNPGFLSKIGPAPAFTRPTFPNRPPNPTNIGSNTMKASNQLDGASDEIISDNCTKKTKSPKKKSKIIQFSLQLDGTGPPVGDDEDEDEDSEAEGNDVGDDLDDDDDDDGGGKEDPNPLCSDDDVSDDDPTELFDTENVVVCQYDKISRTKSKWRFSLKSGVMSIEGRDYVFSKATGEAEW